MIIQSISQVTSISRPKLLIIFEIILDNYLYYLKTRRLIVEGYIVKAVLILTYILIARFLRWSYQADIKIPKELLNIQKNRYLIIANHQKAIDPYLLFATLPFQTFCTLLPIRFFTANIFLKTWWQRCLLFPFGSFRAYSTEGKISGVKGGLQISDKGQSLLIFPEGKRVKPNIKVEPKIGIAYLAQRRDFIIIPVHIDYINNTHKKKAYIRWGKPFKVEHKMKSKELNYLSKHIFSKVRVLSDKII